MKHSEARRYVKRIVFTFQKCRSNVAEVLNPGELVHVKGLDKILWDDDLLKIADRLADAPEIRPSSFWNLVFMASRSNSIEIMMILDGCPLPEWEPFRMLTPWDPEESESQ